jgi:hypothetical protein
VVAVGTLVGIASRRLLFVLQQLVAVGTLEYLLSHSIVRTVQLSVEDQQRTPVRRQ